MVSLSPRTEYFPTPTRDSFELPGSPLDPTSHWRPPSTFWRREETLQFIEPPGRPAETFAQMPIVQAADTKGPLPPPPQKGLFRSRTLSVKKENKKPGGKRDGESNVGGRRGSGVSEKLRRKKNSLSGSGGILERAKTMRWGSVGSLGMYSAR